MDSSEGFIYNYPYEKRMVDAFSHREHEFTEGHAMTNRVSGVFPLWSVEIDWMYNSRVVATPPLASLLPGLGGLE
jgi:hypothetical protein